MEYKVTYKTEINSGENVTIKADGYTSLRVYNSSPATTLYLDGIQVFSHSSISFDEQPYVTVRGNRNLTWDSHKESDNAGAVIVKVYYTRI